MDLSLRHFQIIFAIGLFYACADSDNTKVITNSDKNTENDSLGFPFDTTLADPMDNITSAENQNLLDEFINTFDIIKNLPSVCSKEFYEYESRKEIYYYEGKRIKGIFIDEGYEGGGGGHYRIIFNYLDEEQTKESVLYVPYSSDFEQGFFTGEDQGIPFAFEVSGQEDFHHPKIIGQSESGSGNYNKRLDFDLIRQNLSSFQLSGNFFKWEIMRKKVNSDYGEIEIYKTVEIDSSVFVSEFLASED